MENEALGSQVVNNYSENKKYKMIFRRRILFLGDDLYECWLDEEYSGDYQFQKLFDTRLIQIYSVKEGTISLWKKYIDIEIPKYERPKYIFLSLGSNDLKDNDYDIDAVALDLIDFLNLLHNKFEDVEIYLSTIIHFPINTAHRQEENELNEWIIKHAIDYGYNVIDNANIIEKRITEDNFDDVFYHDYEHLGQLGYKLMSLGLKDITTYNLIDDELLHKVNELNGENYD